MQNKNPQYDLFHCYSYEYIALTENNEQNALFPSITEW